MLQCVDLVDKLAERFVLIERTDLQAMAHMSRDIEALADHCEASLNQPDATTHAEALRIAADRIKNIILDREADPDAAMQSVSTVIDTIQRLVRPISDPLPTAGTDVGMAAQAEPAGAAEAEPSPTASGNTETTAQWVDDAILTAYAEQQASVLPEMEHRVLAFEKSGDPAALAELKRLIHTLKGESGVVGAVAIERICHRVEDYLVTAATVGSDILLDTLDWIGIAVQAFVNNRESPPADALIARYEHGAEAPQPPAAPPTGATTAIQEADHASPAMRHVPIADPDLASDFISEAGEHFEDADHHLLILEKQPDATESISAVFRAFHTLKGVAGFLGLTPLGDLAHAAETLLDDVRKGKRTFEGEAVEATFSALDHLKVMTDDLREALAHGSDLPVRAEHGQRLATIEALNTQTGHVAKPSSPPDSATHTPPAPSASSPPVKADTPAPSPRKEPPQPGKTAAPDSQPNVTTGQTMKVDAVRIDLLLDTIGELVIAESIVSGDPAIRGLKSLRVEKSLALLGKITRSLQDMTMSMRLVPIDPVFRKMARLVRDLSVKSGKTVNLDIIGGETEIDKSMVDKLGDPLVHMIRNAMDHGIEPPGQRETAGKPPTANVILRAFHNGGNIMIEIQDDGRGLDREAIIAKAVERGLIQSGAGLSDADAFAMIFESGFSTAKQVTEISGRGVGMDVVRRNIESLRGKIMIRSVPGEGSTFTIALPLTTAIIDGMLVKVGHEAFIMPTLSIVESFSPTATQIHTVAGKAETVCFRNTLLPLIRLSRILHIRDAKTDPSQAIVTVIEESGRQWGVMVDELLGQQQVVIKSLGDGLGKIPGIAGASIMTDGRPGLILDTAVLPELASLPMAANT